MAEDGYLPDPTPCTMECEVRKDPFPLPQASWALPSTSNTTGLALALCLLSWDWAAPGALLLLLGLASAWRELLLAPGEGAWRGRWGPQ